MIIKLAVIINLVLISLIIVSERALVDIIVLGLSEFVKIAKKNIIQPIYIILSNKSEFNYLVEINEIQLK